jgi:hypothetical protein
MSRIRITLAELKASTSASAPPDGLPPALLALWHDANGDWDAAHEVAQDIDGADGAWIHAYLHRKEGDPGKAAYWYRRAGKSPSTLPLTAEWDQIAGDLIGRV